MASELKGPYELLAQDQDAESVHSAVAGLPPLRGNLVRLAFLQELTHENIGDLMGMPLGTVKSHMRRALVSMRVQIKPQPLRLVG
jgi:DNA-directed RNA polymerase specialized sigma24 family protein